MNIFSYLLDPANWSGSDSLLDRLGEHLFYTVVAVALAAVIGIPLGILIGHTGRGNFFVIGLSNAARAVPTLGFAILMVLVLSTGALPVLVVLTVLALPAVLTATSAGVANADRDAVHAARALGMTPGQVVGKVELPLAMPLVISGIRSATLQVVATATVAAYVSGGGLGQPILDGLQTQVYPEVFAGALIVAVLAIVLDLLLGVIIFAIRSRTRTPSKSRAPAQPTPEVA